MRAAFLSCCLLASVAFAAPPELSLPAEVPGAVGAFVRVPATTQGKVVQWLSLDAGLAVFPVELLRDSKTAVVTAPKAGRFRLVAYTAAGDEPSLPAFCTVIIGDAPPGPPPPPPPPGPDDPLLPTLRAIYGADLSTTKQADVKALATIMRESAAVADDARLTTYRQVNDAVASVTMRAVPLPRLAPLREVVRGEFAKQFGEAGEQSLTPELRGKLKVQFVRVAELFTELAK
jgi:hypothetical protein